jgi:PAS domain S-box-containing protein
MNTWFPEHHMDTTNSELIVSLLQSTLDSVTDGVLVVDLMGKVILYNRQFERMWNIPPDVLESKRDEVALKCILSQLEDPQDFLERVSEIYSHPKEERHDTVNFADGRVFARYTRPQKMGDEIVGRIWSFCDVSHNHRADKARLRVEEKYRSIFDNAPVGIVQSTLDGKLIDVNRELARIFGYESPAKMITLVNRTTAAEAVWASPKARTDCLAKAVSSPGKWFVEETQYRRKDSSIIDGRIAFRIIPGDDGIIEGFIEDITERKLVENKLRDSERFLRQTEKIARIGGWKVDPIMDSVTWTEGVYDIVEAPLDYKPDLEQGLEFYTPPYRTILREAATQAIAQNQPYKIEAEVITTTGKHLWTEVRGLMRVEDGGFQQIVGTFQDITERKQSEDALRESRTRYQSLFQSLRDLINMHSEMLQNENQHAGSRTLPDVSKDLEMNFIENALRKTRGKVQPAAKLLGISRFTLIRQMAKRGISAANYK